MSSTEKEKPETLCSWVEEEHYERVWKIKGLPNAIENKYLELLKPLELETSADSPLHSKWIISVEKGFRDNEMSLYLNLDTIYNKDIKEIQSQVVAEFRSDRRQTGGFLQASETLELKRFLAVSWYKPISGNWNWNKYLNSEGEATLYIKLTLYNPRTENLEDKFKHESVSNARQNLAHLLEGGRTDLDLKIVCSDGREVKCHKEMLKVNSPVFKTMLNSGLKESQSGVINVTDISKATMDVVVQYMYTGQLLATWRQPEITLELTYTAGKYQMATLLNYLDNVIGDNADDSSSSSLLSLRNLAEKLSLKKAEAKLTERIINRTLSIKSPEDIVTVFGNDD